MVDKNIVVEQLKPELWAHLSEVLDMYCPSANIIHVLKHEKGVRAVMQNGENVGVDSHCLKNPQYIWGKFPKVDEIRIYTEVGLKRYERKIQDTKIYDWDIDEYLEYQYKMLENTAGIQVFRKNNFPRHIFQILKKWIKEDGTYLFWITKQRALFFNCILVVENEKIKILTTSGRYGRDWDDIEKVKTDIKKEFPHLSCHVIIDYK